MFHLVGESSWHNSAWSGAILHRTPNEFEEHIFWFSQRSSNRNAREIWSKSAFSERAAIHLICIYLQIVTSKPSYFSQKLSMILVGRSCLKCAAPISLFYHTFCVHFTFFPLTISPRYVFMLFEFVNYLCSINIFYFIRAITRFCLRWEFEDDNNFVYSNSSFCIRHLALLSLIIVWLSTDYWLSMLLIASKYN